MFENILAPIFDPLLVLPIFWVVLIMSFVITVIITLIYKYTTNQSLMKDLKDEMKALQKEMKELRNNPKQMMAVQKKAMQTNMKYMSHSLRSTLFTFIPIILIFGWMNSHLAYQNILPGQEFTTSIIFYDNINGNVNLIVPKEIKINDERNKPIENNEIMWVLSGEEGEYLLEYYVNDKSYTREVVITKEQKYFNPIKIINDKTVKQININTKKIKVMNLFGWELGWLGSYILLSIIFSMILRKVLKVY